MAKIKRDDHVVVIAGRDLGKRGKVRKILANDRLIVSGVNMVKKHTRPSPQSGSAGGILEKEAPIQLSNVAIFNTDSGAADRIGYEYQSGKKVRIFKSSGKAVDS